MAHSVAFPLGSNQFLELIYLSLIINEWLQFAEEVEDFLPGGGGGGNGRPLVLWRC